jgi:hypothetical protein
MRFHVKGALFFLLLYVTATPVASAQEKGASSNGAYRVSGTTPDLQHKPIASRLLTPNEGLAILSAALDSRHSRADFSSDCSHFVHELYERAGFLYEYASSSDLYGGTYEFRQVANPQPGDLIVWPGHTGIVVDPDQQSFFSVLSSGPGVDSYDLPYWKQRGQSPSSPFTMPWNCVFRCTAWSLLVTLKSGTSVLPSISMCSSTPLNLPVEASVPPMPENPPRSARLKSYEPERRV